jgi:hypothetical protein
VSTPGAFEAEYQARESQRHQAFADSLDAAEKVGVS